MNARPTRLKWIARFAYGDAFTETDDGEGDVLVFGSNGPFGRTNLPNTLAPAIIVGRKGSYGKVNWSEQPCFASDTTFFIDSSQTREHLRWLFYILQTLRLDEGSGESAVPGLSREDAYDRVIAKPELDEQRCIANFLDRETSRIDALIAAKERLLELLAEKRRALITQAVTKGLNPNAPMRDSGLPWLGEIPRHWEVLKLKYLSAGGLVNGLFKKKDQYGAGTKLVNVFDVYRDDFVVDPAGLELVQLDDGEMDKYRVLDGDIFFVRSSLKLEGVAASACVTSASEEMVFECHLIRSRPDQEKVVPQFLINYLNAAPIRAKLVSLADYVTMATVDQDSLASFPVSVPPMDEQLEIVQHLNRETLRIERLKKETTRTINLLRERRSALIAAAVTGKMIVH